MCPLKENVDLSAGDPVLSLVSCACSQQFLRLLARVFLLMFWSASYYPLKTWMA